MLTGLLKTEFLEWVGRADWVVAGLASFKKRFWRRWHDKAEGEWSVRS